MRQEAPSTDLRTARRRTNFFMVSVAERHQYFELVEDQRVPIVVGNDAFGVWPQCLVYPVVHRGTTFIHTF